MIEITVRELLLNFHPPELRNSVSKILEGNEELDFENFLQEMYGIGLDTILTEKDA